MEQSICVNCGKSIKKYFPVGWCHVDSGNIYCFPNSNLGSKEYDLTATPKEMRDMKGPGIIWLFQRMS